MADVETLIGKLRKGDYYSRSTAARALGEAGGEKAADALIEALSDEDDWVKEYAAESLGKLACSRAVGPLSKLLDSSNYKVRSAAAEALGRIGGEEARGIVESLQKDRDRWVREVAMNALKHLSDQKSDKREEKSRRTPDPVPETVPEDESALAMSEEPAESDEPASAPTYRLSDHTPRTPEEIVALITKGTSIQYKTTRSGFLLRVPVGGNRHQKVRLKFDSTDEDGSPIIQIFTIIGPAQASHYRWALKLNPAFSYGAIGLVTIDGKEFLAIMNTLLEESVDEKALEKSVWTLARKGDALERKLIQKDMW